ncbi:hypothetical protein HY310_02380 [Candidatus Microgenomates bacterium]|nr:hypothetical protein [Candidatus Microgenomates bacterium]
MKKIFLAILVIGLLVIGNWSFVWAASCSQPSSGDDENVLKAKIEECTKLLQMSVSATKPHEQVAISLERDIANIEANIKSLSVQIDRKKEAIDSDSKKFETRQKMLDSQVRDFYKRNWTSSLEYFLVTIFSQEALSDTLHNLAYRQNLINQEKNTITSLVLDLNDLQKQKQKLEESQSWLATKQISLATTLAPIKKLVAESKAYQSQLTQTVGSLSARQQALLAEKTGNFSTTVGNVPDAQDPNSSIEGFRNNAPSGSFAGFSFGAPHRKGMSQYGAYGRAKSGQNAESILHAYYGGIEIKKDYSTSININVQGYGSFNIEDYVKRIYEVPNSWGDNGGYEALKAQAVAARSYALAYTGNGSGSICATESCQVFQSGAKGGNWDRAVNDTKGWVLVNGGQPFSSWYAASAGGYTNGYSAQGWNTPGVWDTKCGNQGCWTGDAYEKIGGSPWFYKAWYKPRNSSASRPNAWLSKDEFTDIANAALLYTKDHNNISHLSQTDKSNSDTWSKDEVRNRLGGDAFGDITSVSVNYSTGGYTSSVVINGRSMPGEDFRTIFNIRAPGEIWLASGLFNIEKK